MEEGQGAICNGDGQLLHNEDGNCLFAELGWRVIRDQFGMVCWNSDGQLCFEQTDEDSLTLMTRSVPRPVSESLVEQLQRVQAELAQSHANLQQAQLVHRSDVEVVQQRLEQSEAQKKVDFQAMAAEMEKKNREHQQSLHAQKSANDNKWATWMHQMQAAQAEKQKDTADESVHRIAKLE